MRASWLTRCTPILAGLLATLLLSACDGEQGAVQALRGSGAREPAQAVLLLTRHLQRNDLPTFARDAVPADLHRQLQAAWQQGRTRWPLDELPFDERLPTLLASLAAPGSEQRLQRTFDRQFAGEATELKAAATAMGLFGAQYLRHEGDFSADERAHYAQFLQALSRWGAGAPLGDPGRARKAIPTLALAARQTGLGVEADFARYGMQASLRRLSTFLVALKLALAGYGLQVDATLRDLRTDTVEQNGDRARVRMRYTLGGTPIEATVAVERIQGRWYLSDYLRHARDAVK